MTHSHPTPESGWDAIVVGSGIGGLTVAALLARLYQRRVLLLERHTSLGGFTHAFRRPGGFHWDVGLHYVGTMGEPRRESDAMLAVTGGEVEWAPLPDPFEDLVFPGIRFSVPVGGTRYRDALVEAFPAEARAIDGYFADVRRVRGAMGLYGAKGLMPEPLRRGLLALRGPLVRLARTTVRDYLTARFQDPVLRAILAARWGDYGVPPADSPFLIHAVIVDHYLDGAWFPAGGASGIAKSVARAVEHAGGMARTNAAVRRILVENGRAVGVELETGEVYRAPVVVSATGVRSTFGKLLPEELAAPYLRDLEGFPPGYACASAHLGLRDDPRQLGVRGENVWFHDALDHDAMWDRRAEALDGHVPSGFLSFPSLRDPLASAHTAEVMCPVDLAPFDSLATGGWKRRGPAYDNLKQRIGDGLLRAAERAVPGLGDLVVHAEVSSPLTIRRFGSHARGEIYGLPFVNRRLDLDWLSPRGPVPGLFLSGVDVMTPGVVGGLMGGVMTVAAIEGMRTFPRVTKHARRLRREGRTGVFGGVPTALRPTKRVRESLVAVRVVSHESTSRDAAVMSLAAVDGSELPAFEAGSHVSVYTPGGWVRPYSLCGDPDDRSIYRLGVLALPEGRASRELVEHLAPGQLLRVSRPVQHFALPDEARQLVLVGGGIGITPLVAMAWRLNAEGRPFVIHHFARDDSRVPLRAELTAAFGDRYVVHLDEEGPVDLDAVFEPGPGRHLMLCGPEGFMTFVDRTCSARGWPEDHVHRESFTATGRPDDRAFQVHLARSGRVVDVAADQTLADALEGAGVPVLVQCGSGTCGSCTCGVVEGEVDHRDAFQTTVERRENQQIAICVSRAAGGALTLDL